MKRIGEVKGVFDQFWGSGGLAPLEQKAQPELMRLLLIMPSVIYFAPRLILGGGPAVIAYSVAFFAANYISLIGARQVAAAIKKLQKQESLFQVLHSRLRHNVEPVAFSGGGTAERQIIEPQFKALCEQQAALQKMNRGHAFVTEALMTEGNGLTVMQRLVTMHFAQKNGVASPEGVSPMVVAQNFFFETISAVTFRTLQNLARFLHQWGLFDGRLIRLLEVVVALEAADKAALGCREAASVETASSDITESTQLPAPSGVDLSAGVAIVVQGLDVVSPQGRCLASGLDFVVEEGAPLLVTGPTASGKSLLGSVLLGTWPTQGHSVVLRLLVAGASTDIGGMRPPLRKLMPVPQRIYLPLGTLGDQVCYPESYALRGQGFGAGDLEVEEAMLGAMRAMGIEHIFTRESAGWAAERIWEDVLSGGEQQRLSLARVAMRRPRFALLDECTSMISADAEEGLFRVLVEDFQVTPITISRQRFLFPGLHRRELRLGADAAGGWLMTEAPTA